MIGNIVQALVIVVFLYIAILIVKSYKPQWFETFRSKSAHMSVPSFAGQETIPVTAPERIVAPGGVATPNAAAPMENTPTVLPPELPRDPLDQMEGKIPIEDNLTHPENSFGPGIQNRGTLLSEASGVANRDTMHAMQTFSPEFAQNGGNFMDGISANGPSGPEYSLV
jgi:hypothetical protein